MKLDTDIFIYSDPHFGHAYILEATKRPFKDIEHMNESLISRWNKVVCKHNKVLVLGDFSLQITEKTANTLKQLNGYKMLIMGNHDMRKSVKAWYRVGFDAVSRYPIIWHNLVFSHAPSDLASNQINLHGHLHSYNLLSNKHKCLSVEKTNFAPIALKEIATWEQDGYNLTFKLKEI